MNHFIAGLCIVDPCFPLQLLDILFDQAITTLNMMRKPRIDPNLSAHEQLFGFFNFNHTPFVPPGTIVLVHYKYENRATYAPHG